ncbi:ESX secretion-associated protein EspG [Amycolatopsis sp. K13G38]|uniref:ESX secretion-associated protein EspG n=1 Tax=Amycolatopsis acididurans TaxID=2724524 RepID=A0ABX1JGG9_9PSEU|nr:ESX secretion-associated protein EspG [Amycolatopsis acididurans]NKQ58703.1 ESX secretion-associated protein EspG [Amycolatopsis acididurans]
MIEISASAFDVVWSDLALGRVPPPLEVPSVGATGREREEIAEAVYDNLAARGLCRGRQLDASLTDRLETLAGAELYVECQALQGGELLRAVAAAGGKRAVLATQPSRTIGMSPIRATEIWSAVVDLLPWDPGPGFGVTLPAAALRSAEDPVFGDGGGSPAHEAQIREALAIQARPVTGGGQFSVRVREGGKLRRAGGLSWFRTDVGTYFGFIAPGRGGQDWATVAPADAARVTARLAEFAG